MGTLLTGTQCYFATSTIALLYQSLKSERCKKAAVDLHANSQKCRCTLADSRRDLADPKPYARV